MNTELVLCAEETAVPEEIARALARRGMRIERVARAALVRSALDELPIAILLAPEPGADPLARVRALHAEPALAFVSVFVIAAAEPYPRIADHINAGAADVLVLPERGAPSDLGERILARIDRTNQLSQLAFRDPLTGLHNRRVLADRLPAELARAARSSQKLCLAMVDLDRFKDVNDKLGHAVGDRVLVAFAQALRNGLRAYDIVCRFGGDELVALFPDCGSSGARAALAKLRERRDWVIEGVPTCTFSAGLAQFPEDGKTATELFDVADANLRAAKARGRDRTVGGE